MVQDKFANSADSLTSPASKCFAITPSDSEVFASSTKALYVGTGGDVALITVESDEAVTFRNTIAGSILDIRARQVLATGTTAQDLVGLA
ncbi:MAG: hypothetical protein NBV68_05940 [Erythrobacter sp.]|uniref:spike base protein, RCAP_Rcc01079 family n=1 Tax=Erythrobacter sp. TaxID=1042 RepID=UPI0025D3F9D7|nr:hypothetical protein [Erythrobacter sp.]MCL9998902.1 hypothetical protein [Erythrobacter sp.]